MDTNFQTNLKKYADLAVNVGLNLQPGQKLILQSLKYGGVPIQTAPLVREIVTSAYQAGARLVDVLWRDDDINLIRFKHAPRDSFEEFPAWQSKGILEVIENGGAMLSISAFDPDLMEGQDPDLLNQQQTAIRKYWKPISTHIGKNTMNWTVLSIPIAGWARKVFPDLPAAEQEAALWDALFKICRVYEEDPIAAWQAHLIQLGKRSEYLNQKAYQGLHYTAPGTDLRIGLPKGHVWRSAGFKTQSGIPFTANIPTEEVFTLPSGKEMLAYSGVPIFRNDYIPVNQTTGGNNTTTTFFAGTLDEGGRQHGIAGLTAAKASGISVVDVGESETKDERIWRVKWYSGLALFSELGLACASGITN